MIRSIVKHRYFKGKDARKGLKRYINYLTYRDEHNLALNERIFFNKEKQAVHPLAVTKFIGRNTHTVAGHELILSPGINSVDARRYTKELMSKLEESLGVRLSWVAIAHKGKHNHIHVLIDGDTSGKRVRLGVEEYRRLREWGDSYLERNHELERYQKRDVDLNEPYKRDSGDCLFESLFAIPDRGDREPNNNVVDHVDHFSAWDKAKAIAELPDEEKIYEAGKVYCKFSTSAELASLENKLRISGDDIPNEQLKNLQSWIAGKEDFGDDHHERLARELYARQKGRAQSKERLVSMQKETTNDSNDGVKTLMLQANDQDSSTIANEEAQWQLKEQQLDQQVQERRMAEDARLAQARQHEDRLWQANNKREEQFLDTIASENPEFKEWVVEAKRLREMQEEKRMEERKVFDEKLENLRKQEEELRREGMTKQQDKENDDQIAQERRDEDERLAQQQKQDDESRANEERLADERRERDLENDERIAQERRDEDERLIQQRKDDDERKADEDRLDEEHRERQQENDERIAQERRDEDERLAQLQKEDEEWRANEERLADERQEDDRYAKLNQPDSKSQSEDDRARVSEYVVDESRKDQQLEIEQQQRAREYKLQNEQSVKQFQKECHGSLDVRNHEK